MFKWNPTERNSSQVYQLVRAILFRLKDNYENSKTNSTTTII